MEHQVFVPVPADDLRAVLRDPARVARCVPGLQQDADADAAAGAVTGRLRLRVGSSTVTYRGTLALAERDPEHFTADCEGAEVRGHGTVKLSAVLRLIPHDGGTRLEFTGEAGADGRTAAFDPEALTTAVRRLLDRLCANLAEEAGPREPGVQGEPGTGASSVFDAEVPPPSLDPFLDEGFPDLPDFAGLPELGELPQTAGPGDAADDPTAPPHPPAEAAHARRTMIGRSAEEVDHAPPRGRYAPVPAPSSGGSSPALRWIAPAAALALASAVVVGRALRRRR
ncbi:carbon monoxide dehydrogenase subunit G [Streptomyces sp. 3211.6]|uniref:SRPBCC family protein n=1 Tax=Streptomyces TaxID=1883 RepID=UPI0009A477BD|nr:MULTISPECIES: SRPBCC domain-containing protein [Streptomyces]RKT05515.1 carbon monoxide dehydrogenase subunit G [Streptomyces sp. 3211.6]RPF41436.1 carbon monoxide dehydrogenase subunit G [Streptomyces sp. Ag109_G2-6]